jgi:L-2-hydroxyglutarate oxidase
MVAALQRLVPDVEAEDLVPAGAGVRAQAINPDGTLLDDFEIVRSGRCVHVVNAPSPAATASLAIGAWIAREVEQAGDVGATADPARGASDPADD